jgi:hypothetical protein
VPVYRTEYYISFIGNQLLQEKYIGSVYLGFSSFLTIFPLNFSIFYDIKNIVEYSHIGSLSRLLFSTVFFTSSKMKKARCVKEIATIIRETSLGVRMKRRRIIPILSPLSINGFSFSLFGKSGFFSFFSFCLYSISVFILRYDFFSFWRMEYVSFFQLCARVDVINYSMILKMNNIWFFHFTSCFFELFYYFFKGFYYGMMLCFGIPFSNMCSLFNSRVLLSLMGFSIF